MEALTSVDVEVEAAEPGLDEEISSDDLLIFYDCETTGLSIYNEHITDVGAKVVAPPVPLETPTFSSLMATSRHISPTGTVHIRLRVNFAVIIVTRITDISTATLRGETPLSVNCPPSVPGLGY